MFEARVKLSGPVVKFHALTKPQGGIIKLYKIDDESRKKKLAALLKILKAQKCKPKIGYETVDGETVAVIRV